MVRGAELEDGGAPGAFQADSFLDFEAVEVHEEEVQSGIESMIDFVDE